MTKLQKRIKSARAARKRSIQNAASVLIRRINPGLKSGSVHVKVKRLKGGGISVIPSKVKK